MVWISVPVLRPSSSWRRSRSWTRLVPCWTAEIASAPSRCNPAVASKKWSSRDAGFASGRRRRRSPPPTVCRPSGPRPVPPCLQAVKWKKKILSFRFFLCVVQWAPKNNFPCQIPLASKARLHYQISLVKFMKKKNISKLSFQEEKMIQIS